MHKIINLTLDPLLADKGVNALFLLATGTIREEASTLSGIAWENAQASINPDVSLGHPYLRGYRNLHRLFEINDESLVPAPESLIKAYLQHGTLRSFGSMIDLYNTVSLNHLISAGAHDADQLGNSVELSRNLGTEKFRALGQKKKLTLPENEYSYKTNLGRPICRLECKQSNDTKLREKTKKWLFVLQGNGEITASALHAAGGDLIKSLEELTVTCCWDSELLDAAKLTGRLEIVTESVD